MHRLLPLVAVAALAVLLAAGCTKKAVISSGPSGQTQGVTESNQGYGYDTGPAPQERPLDEGAAAPAPVEEARAYDNQPYWEQQNTSAPVTGQEFYFAMQVGSFSSPDNAEAFSNTLRNNGFESTIETVDVTGATQHRVIAIGHGREADIRDRLAGLGVYDPIVLYKSASPPERYPHGAPASAGTGTYPGGGAVPPPDAPPPAGAYPGAGATVAGPDEYVTLEEAPAPVGEYTYQVGSFSLRANAESLARALETRGFSTGVEQGVDDRGQVFTVTATGRGSEDEVLARLEQAGIYDPIMLRGRASQAAPPPPPPGAVGGAGVTNASGGAAITYQVGAFSSRANADALRDRLNAQGFDAHVEAVTMSGTTHYKVLATGSGNDADNRARLGQLGIHDPLVRSY